MAATIGIVGGAAKIAGGIIGGNASAKAASEQAAADQQALSFQEGVYGNTQANLNPFISTGTNALGSVAQLYGLATPGGPGAGSGNALGAYKAYQQTPFYQFPLQQGQQSLAASGAARGLTLSGGQSNAIQAYGQNYASTNFQNYINGLTGLAGLGQSSAVALGNQGNAASQQVGNVLNNIGNAQAAGTVGQANGLQQALSGIAPLLGGNQNSSYGGGSGTTGNGSIIGNALSNWFGGGSSTPSGPDPFQGNTMSVA